MKTGKIILLAGVGLIVILLLMSSLLPANTPQLPKITRDQLLTDDNAAAGDTQASIRDSDSPARITLWPPSLKKGSSILRHTRRQFPHGFGVQ